MDFEKICMMFSMKEPYYGILLSAMERLKSQKTPTLCVTRSGNVFRLLYNKTYVESLDMDAVLELLKHEVLHLAFNHFTLFDTQAETSAEHTIRNIAADLEVNSYLKESIIRRLGGCLPDRFGWDKMLGTREYYQKLQTKLNKLQQHNTVSSKQKQETQSSGEPSASDGDDMITNSNQTEFQSQNTQDDNSNKNNNAHATEAHISQIEQEQAIQTLQQEAGKQLDDHSEWLDFDSEQEKETISQVIDELLVFAADEVEKGRGDIPGELTGKIKLLRERKRPKPAADWKRFFRRYLGHEFSDTLRKSKKRQSRRFPEAAGNRHKRKSHILVGIDTSGSISMPEYREFFGQIKTLSQTATFHIAECDSRIQYEYDYTGKPNEVLHGGGGTSFQPVIDMYNQNRTMYDALVYFTDGECKVPADTPKDTLWVISSASIDRINRKNFQINGASVVFIPKK